MRLSRSWRPSGPKMTVLMEAVDDDVEEQIRVLAEMEAEDLRRCRELINRRYSSLTGVQS